MATEAATGQPANVQAYLNKHSISTLFEDLTSLLVKELPDNPLDFLILKLQARKKKTTGTTSRSVTGPKKLDVTGTTAPKTERGKPAARPSSVKPSSTTTKPTRPTSSSSSSSRPTTTKPTGPSKPSTTTSTAKERSTVTKSAPTTKVVKPTGVKPPTTASTGIKRPTSSSSAKPTTTATKTGSAIPRKPVKSGTTGIPTKSGTTPTKGATPTKSRTPSDSPAITRKTTKPVTTVTEPPPSTQESPKPTDTKEEEDEEKEVIKVATCNDSEDEEEEEDKQKEQKDTPVELNELISQLKRSKNPHKQDKSHLTALINARQSGISEGYISDNEEEEEEEDDQLEVAENIDALKEEGVVLTGEAKKISLKAPTVGPNVDLQVLVCARCAKILSRDEETISVSSSVLNSVDNLESASQVTSSHTSYPQWDTDESGSMTVKQKWATTTGPIVSDETSSVASSHDTWKGLAPVSRHAEGPSDQESDLQLPQPVDYHKPEEDTTEKEESSLIED